jgi:hypothetical protein
MLCSVEDVVVEGDVKLTSELGKKLNIRSKSIITPSPTHP